MLKYSNFAIVFSFFGLWLNSLLSDKYQLLLGFSFIFTFGILHGANDLILIQKLNNNNKQYNFLKILAYYIVIVLFGILLFYAFPLIALLGFILVSGYHFGEQQWQCLEKLNYKWYKTSFQLTYGVFILFLLFIFHSLEVQNIVLEITNISIPLPYIFILCKIIGVLLLIHVSYLYIKELALRKQILLEVFYIAVYGVIFLSSSLIWGFAIFFIIWHSIPSIIDQILFLHQEVNFNTFKLYIKSAFMYWIASLFGIALLYFVFREEKIFNALFFSFLAAITFPHALVILKMFNKKQ